MNTDENTSSNNGDKHIQEIEKKMKWSIGFAIGLISLILFTYFRNFHGSLSDEHGNWGTFGDFVGGVLNPTIAALALFWLINSVKLQIEELKKTNNALEATVKTSQHQQTQIGVQNFENLFFQLLTTLSNVTKDIRAGSPESFYKKAETWIYKTSFDGNESSQSAKEHDVNNYINEKFRKPNPPITGKESIKDHMIFFKSYVLHPVQVRILDLTGINPWESFYNDVIDDYFGSYFRICYQIIKLIDQNETLVSLKANQTDPFSEAQKKYFDIFRAQLTSYELEAIFFNCLTKHGGKKFKEMIERYGLFEHLLLDQNRKIENSNKLTMYAYFYNPRVFEKNKEWRAYFLEINSFEGRKKYHIREDTYVDINNRPQNSNLTKINS